MKIWKSITTRLNIIIFFVVLIIAQVIIFIAVANRIANHLPALSIIFYLISFFVILDLIQKDKASAYKVKWLIIVMSFPVFGGIVYLLYGDKRPTRKIAAMMKEHALIANVLDCDSVKSSSCRVGCDRSAGLIQYIRRASSYPAFENTGAKYYTFGELMFEDMLTELESAEKFIFVEYFIISESKMWDRIIEILIRKAADGVDVRLIFDDFGSLKLFTNSYIADLRSKNIKIVRFSPIVPFLSGFMNNRNHRKIVVIDGHTAFNGGMNIADEYINLNDRLGLWKDTGVRLKGDAVWSFTLMFIETWDAFCKPGERIDDYTSYKNMSTEKPVSDGLVLPYGDSPLDGEQLGENVYIEILNQARSYVYIFTPYLIISEKMIHALQMAAKRGVDVRIVTPGIPDKKIVYRLTRSYYRYLLDVGIRIYEYSLGFLHAKSFVCDDEIAVVGTINLDYRSLYLHFECATLLYNSSIIKDVKEDALKTMSDGREVFSEKRTFLNEFIDAILHFFAPLM
ncbi:MAG: cardiolipin synthase [Defluviitaleaceae bacterium]|nr:cardiolipin synthase [Defluviitaleaceae bacterium]